MNRVLGLRLSDYGTAFRAFPAGVLSRIPYHVNADDRMFDIHTLIQCRALGARVREVQIAAGWDESSMAGEGVAHALRAVATAAGYRLHQLHLIRRGRYFVDERVHYTLKRSETSSHMQIVDAIAPGSRVLDLGCSQGLLAAPLREKGVTVVGVDVRPPSEVAEELEAYYQRDLEQPLELPTGRVFDYVVVSDVIEHLRNRTELLRSARRYLREGGRLIISTPNVALWFYRLSLLIGRFEYGPRGVLDETHVHLFTRASFRRQVEGAGFHVLRERVTSLPFEVVFESTGRSRLVRGVGRTYHALARLWPGMFAYQNILEAEIITLDEESTWR
jgi:methionine biosynthesis protein MetW